jgi:hypothetical protein
MSTHETAANPRGALDAGLALVSALRGHLPGATERGRWLQRNGGEEKKRIGARQR